MATEQDTKQVLKMLTDAGWTPARKAVGSHQWWVGPNGTGFSVVVGHRKTSPGIYRNLLKAMKEDEEK